MCPDEKTLKKFWADIKCPCKCADGKEREMEEDGTCDCSCKCEDGTKHIVDENGDCPCPCECKNCRNSTIGIDG